MDVYAILKLAVVITVLLLLSYFILNTVLLFIVRFSDQLRLASKNVLIAAGVVYFVGLVFFEEWILSISRPLIDFINDGFPGFLTVL